MNIDAQQLQQITIDVCQSMLGLTLHPISSEIDSARLLVASVEIRGERNAAVDVFAHEHLMAAIAEAMFCSDRGSLSQDEIRDAFGEIANMIGGNVKGMIGGDSELSLTLPTVGDAKDSLDRLTHESLRTTFDCCGHPLTIVLREVMPDSQSLEAAVAL
jgi:chemotaxis protein CheX